MKECFSTVVSQVASGSSGIKAAILLNEFLLERRFSLTVRFGFLKGTVYAEYNKVNYSSCYCEMFVFHMISAASFHFPFAKLEIPSKSQL